MRIKPEFNTLDTTKINPLRIEMEFNGTRYLYSRSTTHLSAYLGGNRHILEDVIGCKDINTIIDKLTSVYGYKPGGGDWPTWKYEDKKAYHNVLKWLNSKGVIIK